ncbi:hypothetical protein HOV93_09470 [Planctomycetes bacterium FF15]|uniref:Transposase n=1 Tax=Bremerella alba TaxID=980252 RepID=A0A7V9A5X2_9BACT|nr:hypothetical protein [Bremerella alba]
MKKSKFTDQQIAFALKQAETGTRVDEVCRKLGVSQQTFYRWKKKFAGLAPEEPAPFWPKRNCTGQPTNLCSKSTSGCHSSRAHLIAL